MQNPGKENQCKYFKGSGMVLEGRLVCIPTKVSPLKSHMYVGLTQFRTLKVQAAPDV